MTRILCLFLFFLAVVANVDSLVNFEFNGLFQCPYPQFRYHMTMFEDDWIFDDAISHMAPVSSLFPHAFRATGQTDNDGCFLWWCDYQFEIYLVIVHSCTFNGHYHKFYYDLGSFYKTEGLVSKTVTINLFNAGEPTIDVIGRKSITIQNSTHAG